SANKTSSAQEAAERSASRFFPAAPRNTARYPDTACPRRSLRAQQRTQSAQARTRSEAVSSESLFNGDTNVAPCRERFSRSLNGKEIGSGLKSRQRQIIAEVGAAQCAEASRRQH